MAEVAQHPGLCAAYGGRASAAVARGAGRLRRMQRESAAQRRDKRAAWRAAGGGAVEPDGAVEPISPLIRLISVTGDAAQGAVGPRT